MSRESDRKTSRNRQDDGQVGRERTGYEQQMQEVLDEG